MKQVNISITDDQFAALKTVGLKRQRTVSWMVRDLIVQYLSGRTEPKKPTIEVNETPKIPLQLTRTSCETPSSGSSTNLLVEEVFNPSFTPCIISEADDEDIPTPSRQLQTPWAKPESVKIVYCTNHQNCIIECRFCKNRGSQCEGCRTSEQ